MQARTTTDENPFAQSQGVFDELTKRLSSREALEMTHGDLERLLDKDGRELLRQLLQDHLDLRGPGEVREDLVGANGMRRPHMRLRERGLKTIFGKVTVLRMGYSAHDTDTLFPKDVELNLPPELYSHGVQRRVADEVIKTSFDQAVSAVGSTTGTTVPKRQIEELTVRAATDFDAFYETRSADSVREASKTSEILALSTDAKGIVMRPEDLREATRKAAAKRTHKMSKRLSRGEKRDCKRMAQVAAVFTIAAFMRKPEDIVTDGEPARDADEVFTKPRPEHKRVWASIAKPPKDVVEEMFYEALRRDPAGNKRWVVLIDGNPTQLVLIKKAARRHNVEPTIVLDVIHVLEYVWKAGFALHGEGNPATQAWVSERLLEILRGNSSAVAAGMRRSATLRRMTAKDRLPVDDCADYLIKYRPYLRYNQYLAAGLPISTGVIEGACRHLIKDRMDITGACWGLDRAEAVLKLRSIRSSGDFDAYWAFHESAENVRNHLDLYRGAPPPTILPLYVHGRGHLRLVK
ncbi:MAG: ISKra4 family transposase [Burkholderiales bacterium]